MGWSVVIEVLLEHEYYAPNTPPVTVSPSDVTAFARAGLLLRQSGARCLVLADDDDTDLPASVSLDLDVQGSEVILVTQGGDWTNVPQIMLHAGTDQATLGPETTSTLPQTPGHMRLAQVIADLTPGAQRNLVVKFAAMSSHWAYHVIGPDNEDVVIEDPEGAVQFDPLGTVDLPDGTPARVIRSRDALPARARPTQRFSLSRPGPFGPRTLIPVLPAPQPLFATVPAPDGAGALIQSDIYVSIF